MGNRQIPDFGWELHYPALPRQTGYYVKMWLDWGNFFKIFATVNCT